MSLWKDARVDPKCLPANLSGFDPDYHKQPWTTDRGRKAAVCFLFAPPEPGGDAARLILTRRTTSVRSHKGQIGFAGGRADAVDGTPSATAVRELEEELGIPATQVATHGALSVVSSIDGSAVVAVVATTDVSPDEYLPSPDEVAYVIAPAWTAFSQDKASPFHFLLFGRSRSSYLYQLAEERVWGLTARILYDASLSASPRF